MAWHAGESTRAKVFWISSFRGLCDVVRDGWRDTAIRPNQIFAASLPNSPLRPEQQSAVVEVVRRELLTPYGLRTLSRNDGGYRGHYSGDQKWRGQGHRGGNLTFVSRHCRKRRWVPEWAT